MFSNLGIFLRKLRIDRGIPLKSMAEVLGISSSYLSAVEHGKRWPTKKFFDSIVNSYSLQGSTLAEFKLCFSLASKKVDLTSFNDEDREKIIEFISNLKQIDEE